MNIIDAYCVACFPELRAKFTPDQLEENSGFGSYVFHEDVFCLWLIEDKPNAATLQRVGDYIEYLAGSENRFMRDLAQIAILECLMNRNSTELAPFIGPSGRALISRAGANIQFDEKVWGAK